MKCPKHKTVIDESNPICPECHFPLQCPRHMEHIDLANRCARCGRPRNKPEPAQPHPHPNRCQAHMLEWDRNGNCGYCGRPPRDTLGPAWPGYAAAARRWEAAVKNAEEYLWSGTRDQPINTLAAKSHPISLRD